MAQGNTKIKGLDMSHIQAPCYMYSESFSGISSLQSRKPRTDLFAMPSVYRRVVYHSDSSRCGRHKELYTCLFFFGYNSNIFSNAQVRPLLTCQSCVVLLATRKRFSRIKNTQLIRLFISF